MKELYITIGVLAILGFVIVLLAASIPCRSEFNDEDFDEK